MVFYSELVPISKFLHSYPLKQTYIHVEKANHVELQAHSQSIFPVLGMRGKRVRKIEESYLYV